MARIGAQISGFELRLLQALQASEGAAALNRLRLVTGRRINDPPDDPSAFVDVSRLEDQLARVQATSENVAAASSIASQTQLKLDEIHTQLDTIRGLLAEDEGLSLSASERAANQSQIDVALESIRSLAGTQIDGRRRLDGSADFRASGRNHTQVRDLRVLSPGVSRITGNVTTPATRATLTFTGAAGQISDDATFTLTGRRGSIEISVTQNQDLAEAADAVNQSSHKTGVTATVDGDDLVFTSVDYGSAASVQIAVNSGTFGVTGGEGNATAYGTDADVTINGRRLAPGHDAVDGNRVSFAFAGERFELVLAAGFRGRLDTIDVQGNPAGQFQLYPDGRTTTLAVPGLSPGHFVGTSGSLLELKTGGGLDGLGANTAQAIRVVDESLARLTGIEGQVEGFANSSVAASAAFLDALETDLQDAVDAANKTDEAKEELLLARNEALAAHALSSLNVLQEQRARMVELLERIASG